MSLESAKSLWNITCQFQKPLKVPNASGTSFESARNLWKYHKPLKLHLCQKPLKCHLKVAEATWKRQKPEWILRHVTWTCQKLLKQYLSVPEAFKSARYFWNLTSKCQKSFESSKSQKKASEISVKSVRSIWNLTWQCKKPLEHFLSVPEAFESTRCFWDLT